jgi:antitoxin CcdA
MTTDTIPRRATNISLPEDVYRTRRTSGSTFRRHASGPSDRQYWWKDRQWAINHADFIQAYNDMIERDGLPLAQYRTF